MSNVTRALRARDRWSIVAAAAACLLVALFAYRAEAFQPPYNPAAWEYEFAAHIPNPLQFGLNRTLGARQARKYVTCSGYALPYLGKPIMVSMQAATGLDLLKRPASLILPKPGCDAVYHVRWVRDGRVRYVHEGKARTVSIAQFRRIWGGKNAPAAVSNRDYNLARLHWQCAPKRPGGRCWSVAATWDARYDCHTTTRMRVECGPVRARDDLVWWRAQ